MFGLRDVTTRCLDWEMWQIDVWIDRSDNSKSGLSACDNSMFGLRDVTTQCLNCLRRSHSCLLVARSQSALVLLRWNVDGRGSAWVHVVHLPQSTRHASMATFLPRHPRHRVDGQGEESGCSKVKLGNDGQHIVSFNHYRGQTVVLLVYIKLLIPKLNLWCGLSKF